MWTKKKRKRKLRTVTIPDRVGGVPSAFLSSRFAIICFLTLIFITLSFSTNGEMSAAEQRSHAKEKPYALIFGTVWSSGGQPVYGVRVDIRRADQKKPRWEIYSDRNGEFAQRLPAGKADYVVSSDLKASHLPKGMHYQDAAEITVQIENDERQDIGLHLK